MNFDAPVVAETGVSRKIGTKLSKDQLPVQFATLWNLWWKCLLGELLWLTARR